MTAEQRGVLSNRRSCGSPAGFRLQFQSTARPQFVQPGAQLLAEVCELCVHYPLADLYIFPPGRKLLLHIADIVPDSADGGVRIVGANKVPPRENCPSGSLPTVA